MCKSLLRSTERIKKNFCNLFCFSFSHSADSVWKDNLGTLDKQPDNDLFSARALGKKVSAKVKTPYESWRHMFINRPCVLFDGCYIGKFKYVRLGENKFQSALNLQVVQYYRCIRFMPDGSCYLLTTADSPSKSVSRLQNTHHLDRAVERGQYELYADVLTIIVKNTNRMYSKCMKFEIRNTTKRKFTKLEYYFTMITRTEIGNETTDCNKIQPNYSFLFFRRVPGYNARAIEPLL